MLAILQYMDGLRGALIVEEVQPPVKSVAETVVQLTDWWVHARQAFLLPDLHEWCAGSFLLQQRSQQQVIALAGTTTNLTS